MKVGGDSGLELPFGFLLRQSFPATLSTEVFVGIPQTVYGDDTSGNFPDAVLQEGIYRIALHQQFVNPLHLFFRPGDTSITQNQLLRALYTPVQDSG